MVVGAGRTERAGTASEPPELRDAVASIAAALHRLRAPGAPAPLEARWAVVQFVADRLATRAADDRCPDPVARLLLDWRDRLSSHLLASRALDELDVRPEVAERLLRRGLEELLAEAPVPAPAAAQG